MTKLSAQDSMDGLSELPAEIMQLIVDRLPASDICNCLATCKQWSALFGSCVRRLAPTKLFEACIPARFPQLQQLDLASVVDRPAASHLQQLSQLHCLQHLSLHSCSGIVDLFFLETLTGLRHLDVRQCRLLAPNSLCKLHQSRGSLQVLLCDGCPSLGCQDMDAIAQLTVLTRLSLVSAEGLASGGLHSLALLRHLALLSLCSQRNLDDQAVAGLAGASKLRILGLDCCPLLTGTCFRQLASLTSLQTLSLLDCRSLEDDALKGLVQLPALQTLILDDCGRLTDAGVAALAPASKLKHLSLRACHLTGEGLAPLALQMQLRFLKLSSCMHLTRQGAHAISQHSRLQGLSLAAASWVDDAFIEHLSPLLHLTALNLSHCPDITRRSTQSFATAFPMLSRLLLSNCKSIRDESACDICRLQHLAELDISCCDLTDTGIELLQEHLPQLQCLNLAGSKISDAGARRLRPVPLLNIRACEGVGMDIQLQHSPIRFNHLRPAAALTC